MIPDPFAGNVSAAIFAYCYEASGGALDRRGEAFES